MVQRTRLIPVVVFSLLLVSCLALWSCLSGKTQPSRPSASIPAPASLPPRFPTCGSDGGVLNVDCPALPNTTPTAQPQWDYFAWNSFIVSNWPALDPAQHGEQRGFPDLNQTFLTASPTSLLVWETFKEKREVFFYPPNNPNPKVPGPWNQAPDYGPLPASVPLCSDSLGRSSAPRRFFGQSGKVIFDSLDETIEVASEALETKAQLCNGNLDPMCDSTKPADCCRVQGLPVGPRVWKGSPRKANPQPVLYEVKVNYDFYKYVTANQYYLDATADAAATAGSIQLPYRTSASSKPSLSSSSKLAATATPPSEVFQYVSSGVLEFDKYNAGKPRIPPALTGAVHLKAAWILLQNEDPSKYHTAEAAYFKTEGGKTCMAYGTFGLVGLHIIQRIHQGSASGSANPLGGTFIFSTFEHVDNDSAGFTYSNFFPGQPLEGPPAKGFYPSLNAALPVQRQYPILPGTVQVNNNVHAAIRGVNPNSVWLNYQLIGTQFQPINIPATLAPGGTTNDPTAIGQPLYLANLVIETNAGLQMFQGLPPLTVPISRYQGNITANHSLQFKRDDKNMSFNGQGYNMGGCMGCHGVAQTKGFSFSFVLLGGQRGANVDTQKNFDVP